MSLKNTIKPWEVFEASPKEATHGKLTHISLFSGCGGFDLGFHQSGFKTIFANDINEDAAETYRHNIGEICTDDIRKVDLPAFKNRTDVVTAGFPCQPFSNAGLKLGFEDTRGTLFFHIANILQYHKPRIVFLAITPTRY